MQKYVYVSYRSGCARERMVGAGLFQEVSYRDNQEACGFEGWTDSREGE